MSLLPKSLDGHTQLAWLYIDQKKWKKASDILDKAEKLHPEVGRVLYTRALSLSRQKKFAEALPYAQKAVKLEPDREGYLYSLASVS